MTKKIFCCLFVFSLLISMYSLSFSCYGDNCDGYTDGMMNQSLNAYNYVEPTHSYTSVEGYEEMAASGRIDCPEGSIGLRMRQMEDFSSYKREVAPGYETLRGSYVGLSESMEGGAFRDGRFGVYEWGSTFSTLHTDTFGTGIETRALASGSGYMTLTKEGLAWANGTLLRTQEELSLVRTTAPGIIAEQLLYIDQSGELQGAVGGRQYFDNAYGAFGMTARADMYSNQWASPSYLGTVSAVKIGTITTLSGNDIDGKVKNNVSGGVYQDVFSPAGKIRTSSEFESKTTLKK